MDHPGLHLSQRPRRSGVRTYAARIAAVSVEGIAVAGTGYGALAVFGADAAAFPDPVLVAASYLALLLLHDGVAGPADMKHAVALRVLASTFIILAAFAPFTRV